VSEEDRFGISLIETMQFATDLPSFVNQEGMHGAIRLIGGREDRVRSGPVHHPLQERSPDARSTGVWVDHQQFHEVMTEEVPSLRDREALDSVLAY